MLDDLCINALRDTLFFSFLDGNEKSHCSTQCGGFEDQRTSSIKATQDRRPGGPLLHFGPMDRRSSGYSHVDESSTKCFGSHQVFASSLSLPRGKILKDFSYLEKQAEKVSLTNRYITRELPIIGAGSRTAVRPPFPHPDHQW